MLRLLQFFGIAPLSIVTSVVDKNNNGNDNPTSDQYFRSSALKTPIQVHSYKSEQLQTITYKAENEGASVEISLPL